MSDTPLGNLPLDPKEQPILDSLLHIRDELALLKADRTTYIRSHDIVGNYENLIEQVHRLNEVREQRGNAQEQNRADMVLDDCFQLISLGFMTIGRNKEAPATYAFTSTMKRLLDHLKEAGFYYKKDLIGLERHIETIREIVKQGRDSGTHSPHLLTLIDNRLDVCEVTLADLKQAIDPIAPELSATYEKLVSILRSLGQCNTRHYFPEKDVKNFKKELQEVESQMQDGHFVSVSGDVIPGEDVVIALLRRCLRWADLVLERRGTIDPRFTVTYEKLREIRNQLERLSLTQAWSLRETDLYSYQRQLDRVDESRVDGNFMDDNGKPADLHAQRTLLYLLRRSYAYIFGLLIASEPVSEALLPIHNQLQTLRRCLVEVRNSGGVSSEREVYPYSMKLNSIDNMRMDGKFMVGKEIPEGQGSLNGLLADCFDLAYDLRINAHETEA